MFVLDAPELIYGPQEHYVRTEEYALNVPNTRTRLHSVV
jgi:hypothetical protein